jgi:hypothetical protein
MSANTTWVDALSTTIMGKPPKKKPSVVPNATDTAMTGEINMAIKITTWLAKVKDAGSNTILTGENMGIISPIAIRNPEMVSFIIF